MTTEMNQNNIVESTIFNLETGSSIKGCVWNILARGLSHGEFLCDGGDEESTLFGKRFPRIAKMMGEMFSNGVAFISTIENDHPEWILDRLNPVSTSTINMLKVLKYPEEKVSNAKKIGKGNVEKGLGLDDDLKEELSNRNGGNDTLTIYYDTTLLEPIPLEDGKLFDQIVIEGDFKSPKNQTLAGFVLFRHLVSGKVFGLVTAHLSSGEGVKDSSSRLAESKRIIDYLKCNRLPSLLPKYRDLPLVLTMDSNSSPHYESVEGGLGDDVNNFFELNDFQNGVELDTSRCYKMRHGAGGQPKKFGSLMYDSIDRIFFSSQVTDFTNISPNELCSFQPVHQVLSREELDNIEEVRLSKDRRDNLKRLVTGNRVEGLLPWSDKVGMGKNNETGVKEVEKKGVKTIVPLYSGDDYGGDLPLSEDSFKELSEKECLALYPNKVNPSDHPPCVCSFIL